MGAFDTRRTAGRLLAGALRRYAGPDTVILGITRGGLIVAYEVAQRLHLPLDVLVVQRIAEPGEPHLTLGCLAEPGHLVVSRRRIRALALPAGWLRSAVEAGACEMGSRSDLYRKLQPRQELVGRRVIIVDDTASTGATLRAAVKAVRGMHAREIVVAVPVAPEPLLARLRREVDHAIAATTPAALIARGIHYPPPLETEDAEVRELLGLDGPLSIAKR
jgi:putative phosphoribosyl transferase